MSTLCGRLVHNRQGVGGWGGGGEFECKSAGPCREGELII